MTVTPAEPIADPKPAEPAGSVGPPVATATPDPKATEPKATQEPQLPWSLIPVT